MKQGATSKDEDSIKNQLVTELALLKGKDPKKLVGGRLALNKEISSALESILRDNGYKFENIEIDKRFAGIGKSLDEDLEDQNAEHTEVDIPFARGVVGEDLSESGGLIVGSNGKSLSLLSVEEKKVNVEINVEDFHSKRKKVRNYVKENMIAVLDPKHVLKLINKANRPLVNQNIPCLAQETGFSRAELHTFYTLYKALCYATSQRYGINEYDVADGIDDKVFRKGVSLRRYSRQ